MDMELLKGLFTGALFGAGLYIVGATNRTNLLNMLKLKDFTLMKTIAFAMGIAAILIHGSLYLNIMPVSKLSIKSMYLGVIIGSMILAVGFGTVGLCPGTAIGSLASGYRKAAVVILGGLFGTYFFAQSYAYLKSLGIFDDMLGGKVTLFHVSDKINYLINIGPLGGVAVGVLFIVFAFMLPENDGSVYYQGKFRN